MKLTCALIMQIVKQAEAVKFSDWDLPIGTSLQITRLMDKLFQEQATIEKERMKILKKYAEVDDKGEFVADEDGNAKITDMEAFGQEFKELLEQEVEIDMKPLKLDFEKLEAKGIVKKPSEITWLLPLVEWDD